MALVMEFKATCGARVRIFDDCYAGISDAELRRRRAKLDTTMSLVNRRIDEANARKRAEATKEEEAPDHEKV